MKTGLVIHVPHASTEIPETVWPQFLVSREAVQEEATVSADLYTDILAAQAWPRAVHVVAPVSRIVVDVERYADDELEDMSKVGRGMIYTADHNGKPIRQRPSDRSVSELKKAYYDNHWTALREAAEGSVLIDLHTYPAEPWPIEPDQAAERPEIDIGFSENLTPIEWVRALTTHFVECGYSVGHNAPYAGVIDAGAQAAVMIEIRRDVVGAPGEGLRWKRLVRALSKMPLFEPSQSSS